MSDETPHERPPWTTEGHRRDVAITFQALVRHMHEFTHATHVGRGAIAEALVDLAAMTIASMFVLEPESEASTREFFAYLQQRLIAIEAQQRPHLAMTHAEHTLSQTGQLSTGPDKPQ